MNFIQWLDGLVISVAGPQCIAKKKDGVKIPCCYQMMLHHQHSNVEGELSFLSNWFVECISNSLSAGTYVSIEGSGKGQCEFVHKRMGPFCS